MDTPQPLVCPTHRIIASELHWVYGFSSTITNGVIDLRTELHSHIVGYIAGTVVVLYDVWSKSQKILKGHIHQIQCIATTPDKSVIFSSDCGPDAILIMWETTSAKALKAISQERTAGLVALDVSSDGAFIGTLSAVLTGSVQELSIWDTKLSNDCPLVTTAVQSEDIQTCIRFNPGDHGELITNGRLSVFVWRHFKGNDGHEEKYFLNGHRGVLRLHELKQSVGEFTLSLFPPSARTAMTATVDGDVIIWHQERNEEEDYAVQEANQNSTDARVMHAVKLVRLHSATITAFTTVGRYITTGDAHGFLRFYDNRLGLVGWLEELNAGGITSISFSALENRLDSAVLTIHVPPFIVGTKSACMKLLHAGLFEEQPGTWVCKGEQVMKPMPDVVRAIAAHPSQPYFALVGSPCLLQVHDYTTKSIVREREFPKLLRVSCVQYSPLGSLLAVGFTNGVFKLLMADTLLDYQSFSYTRSTISLVEFSRDGTYIATADTSCCVALLYCKLVKVVVEIKKTQSVIRDPPWLHVSLLAADEKWECVGKYRSHAKAINGLLFAAGDGGVNRMFSLGQDCMIVEYDLNKSFVDTGLKLKGTWQLNSLALPTGMITTLRGAGELQVITSDEGFKMRIYDAERFHSIKTFLGPVFGTAIHKFWTIHDWRTSKSHLVYSTREAVIGLMTFPSEDKTHINFMGVVAHPGPIACLEVSHDSKFVITCCGEDSIVIVWRINIPAWDTYVALEQRSVGAHAGVEDETLLRVRKYFFYSQLREKDEFTVEERNLDQTLGVDRLMECYNGLGVYFSKADLKGMMDEINRSFIRKKGEGTQRVHFDDFFQTYMAHKPVLDFDEALIQAALNEIGADQATGNLSMDTLIKTLLNEGEQMSREELQDCVKTCMGQDIGLDSLPQSASGAWFYENLLGTMQIPCPRSEGTVNKVAPLVQVPPDVSYNRRIRHGTMVAWD